MISMRELCLSLEAGESCLIENDSKNKVHTIVTYSVRSKRKFKTEQLAAISGDSIVRFIRVTRLPDDLTTDALSGANT